MTTTSTLKNFVPRYLEHAAKKLKPRTLAEYTRLLEVVIVPAFGRRRMAKLTLAEVEQWHTDLAEVTPVQANRALATLSAVLTLAARWGVIPANPCRGVQRARETSRERYYNKAELGALLEAIAQEGPQEAAFLTVLLYTGARPGELLGARWEWLGDTTLELPDSKTGRRTIYLPPPATEALGEPQTHGLLFPNVNPTTLWRRVRAKAGLKNARLYDLRHTFASNALSAELPLETISQLLGHKNPRTTRRYVHLQKQTGIDAAARTAEMIGR